jgi:hypothetical protein
MLLVSRTPIENGSRQITYVCGSAPVISTFAETRVVAADRRVNLHGCFVRPARIFERPCRSCDLTKPERIGADEAPFAMKVLQLTAIVKDLRTSTMTAHRFLRSPVSIGRQDDNALRLDARLVSRHHGAFVFSGAGLRYLDLRSANGSFVDGELIQADTPAEIRSSSVITIVPFQIVVHADLIERDHLPSDPDARTSIAFDSAQPGASVSGRWADDSAPSSDVVRQLLLRHGPIVMLRQATRSLTVVAERMLAAGSRAGMALTPLRLAKSPEDIVALLVDPRAAEARLVELRELLDELFRPRLTLLRDQTRCG